MPPKKQEITPAALEKAFKLFDEDNSGFITADELLKIFKWPTSGGTEMSMKDAKEWIDRYDGQNGEKKDGMLSIKELAVALADDAARRVELCDGLSDEHGRLVAGGVEE